MFYNFSATRSRNTFISRQLRGLANINSFSIFGKEAKVVAVPDLRINQEIDPMDNIIIHQKFSY